jgi:Rrf2 family protein
VKLVPTRRTDYGIRALLVLAEAEDPPVAANVIGRAMDIPTGFLQQVLRELQQAGLVTSRPGPSGGYALARPAEDISVLQIVEALEGPLRSAECALRGGPCHWDDVCALHWVWSSARDALCDELAGASLGRVAADDRALAAGTRGAPADSHRARHHPGA